ncbi:MAG TPA: DAK2 domain-containing protein [Dehalococcoidia bacterium]
MTTDTARMTSLGGHELRELFAAATAWLERHTEAINAINVFPVPDGDTGTNMLATMRAMLEEARTADGASAGAVAAALARGALMGARGNSGVILSQIIHGFAQALAGKDRAEAPDVVLAFQQAARTAYQAVTKPVEGTILTVAREVSEAGSHDGAGGDLEALFARYVDAAQESVARTPSLLPILAEAGVVDAGGQGLAVILEGALRYLRGQTVDLPPVPAMQGQALPAAAFHHDDGEPYGYCTEFLIEGEGLDAAAIRRALEELGTSVLAVGGGRTVHVHVHTQDPGRALSYGTSLGSLTRIKVDNMQAQHEALAARSREAAARAAAPTGRVSTVAVLPGDGLAEVARSMGATVVVHGGQTMNPSTQEILRAIDACPTDEVLVLPNNKNVMLSAQQAAKLASRQVAVVPTRTVPEGMAALVALNPDADLEQNARAAEEAVASVQTAEITLAARDAGIGGLRIHAGQIIGIVNGDLSVAEETVDAAVEACLAQMVSPETGIITLYYGADVTEGEAGDLAGRLRERYPEQEVEVLRGGQPHYFYIVSVE